jgi:hypothetical protein
MIINDYFKFDNNELFKTLKNYIKTNPCCKQFPNCNHPAYQSDSNLFNIKETNIEIIKNNYFNCLGKILNKNKLEVIEHKSWVYLTLKNESTKPKWHTHKEKNNDNINVSGLLYITETNIGTEFKTDFLNFEIIPHINRWFLWDSSIIHRPKDIVSEEDRIVIATATILRNEIRNNR